MGEQLENEGGHGNKSRLNGEADLLSAPLDGANRHTETNRGSLFKIQPSLHLFLLALQPHQQQRVDDCRASTRGYCRFGCKGKRLEQGKGGVQATRKRQDVKKRCGRPQNWSIMLL